MSDDARALVHNARVEKVLEHINTFFPKQRMGIVFNSFDGGFVCSYRAFQRYVHELIDRDLIYGNVIRGGPLGTSTFICKKGGKQ